jgi:hypothetical protein
MNKIEFGKVGFSGIERRGNVLVVDKEGLISIIKKNKEIPQGFPIVI